MNTFLLLILFIFVSKYSQSFQHFSIRRNVKAICMTNKFADPKNYIVFKKLFGDDSALLIDFVNKALPKKQIKKIEYIPIDIEPEIRIKDHSVLDVLCTDKNGSKCIIQMHCFESATEKGLEKSVFYYGSNIITGLQYSDLEVIFIAITDFVLFSEITDYLSYHAFRDIKTDQQNINVLSFVFIEIPKYQIHENAQGIDEWIDLFKTASSRKTFQTSNPIIEKAYKKLEIIDNFD